MSDSMPSDMQRAVDSMLADIHNGALADDMIHGDYYSYISKHLAEAVTQGIGGSTFGADTYQNTLKAYLDQNIFAFSGARSLEMAQQFKSFLTDDNGDQVSFSEFKRRVLKVNNEYNIQHLEAEYNSALSCAQAAEQWEGLQAFPALEYRTVGDDRVRPEHAKLDKLTLRTDDPIWNTIYPPNGWGCRCNVVPSTIEAVTVRSKARDLVKATPIPKYFKRNVGKDKVVFSDDHPYFTQVGKKKLNRLQAVRNYGMREAAQIVDMENLPQLTSMQNPQDAVTWFSKAGKNSFKAADGLSVSFDDKWFNRYKDGYFNHIHHAPDVIREADEIWGRMERGRPITTYIKYYDGQPVIVTVNSSQKASSFLTPTPEQVEQYRRGALKLKR